MTPTPNNFPNGRTNDMHAPHACPAPRPSRDTDERPARLAHSLRVFRLLCVVALIACAAGAAGQRVIADAPAGEREAAKGDDESLPANSTVRGRAVFEETGRPVRRARVMLVGDGTTPSTGVTAQAVTNARGEFEFKGVRAGRYFVAVFAPGVLTPFSFVSPNAVAVEGVRSGWGDLPEVRKYFDAITVDGAGDSETTVKARRGGAISGRVTYEDGSPAVSASVSLYRKTPDGFSRTQATQQADDRGVYRFTALAPGEYVVGVAEMVVHGDAGMGRASAVMYAGGGGALITTYYPATTNIRAATPVAVGAGEEHEGADISIVERELHTVSGTVRARAGSKPVAGARLTVTAADTPPEIAGYSAAMPDAVTDEQGRFTLREIPAGDYVVTVRPTADVEATELLTPTPQRAKPKATPTPSDEGEEGDGEEEDYRAPLQRYTVKQQPLKVASADVDNLDIALDSGSFVTGTITFEGGKGDPAYVSVTAVRVGDAHVEQPDNGTYFQGQFALGGLSAGRYFLSVGAGDEEQGEYYVKSMTLGGADLTREPLTVGEGATARGVRVVLATGLATLKGRVLTSAGGAAAGGAGVVAVPADAAKWQTPDGQTRAAAEATGKFEIDLAPGEYLVFALPRGAQALTPDEIKARAAHAQRVTLRPKQTTSLELTLRDDK